MSWGQSVRQFVALNRRVRTDLVKGMDKITVRTGNHLKQRAQVNNPVDTGFSKRSWAISEKRQGLLKHVSVFNTATTAKNPRNKNIKGILPGIYYLPWVEYGTRSMAPRRFFLKSINQATRYQNKLTDEYFKKIARKYNV